MEDSYFLKQNKLFKLTSLLNGLAVSGTLYVSAYLKTLGLSTESVGFFTSARSIVGIFVPVVWGLICDKMQAIKKPYIVCLIGTTILFPLIPFSETVLRIVAITPWLTVLSRFFYRPLESLTYTWLAQLQKSDKRFDYNKIQTFFTLGRIVGSIIYSILLTYLSLRTSFYGVGIMGLIIMLVVPFLMDIKPENANKVSFKELHLEEIFKNPELILYFIFAIAIFLPSCVTINYSSYLIEELGLGNNYVAIITTISAIVNLPPMLFANKLYERFGIKNILITGAILAGLVQITYSFCQNATQLIIITIVMGIVDALRFSSLILYAYQLAPKQLRNTVVMLNSTISAFATTACASLATIFIDGYGVRAYYAASGIIPIIVTILYIIITKIFIDKK